MIAMSGDQSGWYRRMDEPTVRIFNPFQRGRWQMFRSRPATSANLSWTPLGTCGQEGLAAESMVPRIQSGCRRRVRPTLVIIDTMVARMSLR